RGVTHKGKEIAKPIAPSSETVSEEDNDPKQAQRDKDMQKNLALIAKYFEKIYKPTNNNLRTSSNFKNKNVDMILRYKNDDHFGQFGNQRTINVSTARVQDDARYNVFTNGLQHPEQYESVSNACLVEINDSNVTPDSPDMCKDDIQNEQNDVERNDERVALANLIANLKLDARRVDELIKCSRDRPPMLAPGRYPQWRSQFLRYVDTGPNVEALRKCILSGPYKPTTVLVHTVEATDDSPAFPEHATVETPTNMSPENKAHFLAEKEAIHLILTGIGDDIYTTVDAFQTAQEMWEAIESL
nr:hypothetical protein [Tanacetum cinerariifolium]